MNIYIVKISFIIWALIWLWKPDFVVCGQQRCWLACTSAQSDQHLCYSLHAMYHIWTCFLRNFNTLSSLCSWAWLFEHYLIANTENSCFFSLQGCLSVITQWIKISKTLSLVNYIFWKHYEMMPVTMLRIYAIIWVFSHPKHYFKIIWVSCDK